MQRSGNTMPEVQLIGVVCLWAMLFRAAWVDHTTGILPDVYTLGGGAFALTLQSMNGQTEQAALGAMTGFALLKGTQLAYRWIRDREGMGSGDPKLMLSLGAMAGAEGVLSLTAGACLLAVALNLFIFKKGRTTPIPFGPYLVVSGFIDYTIFCYKGVLPCLYSELIF